MQITSIRQQVKRKDRYSISVDGKYAFSLSESALVESRLASGQELDEAQLKVLKKKAGLDKAYGQAVRYAAMRLHSEWEMQMYLKRKEVDEPSIQYIIAKLVELGLCGDQAFAESWVSNRRLLKNVSKRRLAQELRAKRVPGEVIDNVLAEDETDERAVLRELVAKKSQISRYQADPTKLMQYLARQGFGYDDIKAVMHASDEDY
jgi:regulatory protein